MATITTTPGLSTPQVDSDSETTSTLREPRSSMTSPDLSRSNSTSPQNPDFSNELATLNNKLIRAINYQTDLDDTLSDTRNELDATRRRVKHLEATVNDHHALISSGGLVSRDEVERQKVQLMHSLAHEQRQRGVMEKDKRGMEQELESLTTALFEEANQMVAAARKEREAADRRSDQLRTQLDDTELLLLSHQEQLAELKAAMHQMSLDREEADINAVSSTAPSTPAVPMSDLISRIYEGQITSPVSGGMDEIIPAPPTSFTHLLTPVLRTDIQAYDDFHNLLSTSRKSSPSSRVSSGSFGTLSVTNLSNLAGKEQHHFTARMASTGSTSSLTTSATHTSSPVASSSTNSSVSSRDVSFSGTPLKETRFYKRVLTECIEPTLRLDTAPGLSWLARRTVINSMAEGSLVVEPVPSTIKCSLCGENREDEIHARTHRFRTSENDTAQRYPLCDFCLTRVRASCDFLGFLRMLKDGYWRADDEESELQAWEECVRLQERMFWARTGGGVLPAFIRTREPVQDLLEQDHGAPQGSDQHLSGVHHHKRPCLDSNLADVKESEISKEAPISREDKLSHPVPDTVEATTSPLSSACLGAKDNQDAASERIERDLHKTLTDAPRGLGIDNMPVGPPDDVDRNSIVMPGAFE
ncbi:MAG: hypothetical protein LQ352_000995 [Teloschistes flavicans]|nr:MAG: hypothetical protein LQ352_000995 [Teloschistes flavicans]